jgi:large subunit ribosomal protein L9
MPTQIILLERIEKLGAMGDVVQVKPGYARNCLLPQGKALRATKENIAYYEAQKAHLQKLNAEKKGEADKQAKKIEGAKIVLIRQAAEGGQLFGSVTSRDIAEELSAKSGMAVTRGQVALNQNFKTIGLFPVEIVLHPEVRAKVTVNIARSPEEAVTQEKTGKAIIASDSRAEKAAANDAKAAMLEDSALAAEQAKAEEEARSAAESAEKAAKKAAKKSKKSDEGEEDAE